MGMFRLDGEIALVTGASRGIGKAIAERLAFQGAVVVVNYHSKVEAAESTVQSFREQSPKSFALRFDVSNASEVEAAFAQVTSQLGEGPTILVNNAGLSRDMLLLRWNRSEFDEVINTNFMGTVLCSQAALKSMVRKRRGRIINLVSVVGEMGNAGQTAYCASKAAVQGFSKALAREYANRGITVNCVAPGFIDSDMTATLTEENRSRYLSGIPVGRFGTVEDVAASVLFLASSEASYITGHTLRVNGGLLIS